MKIRDAIKVTGSSKGEIGAASAESFAEKAKESRENHSAGTRALVVLKALEKNTLEVFSDAQQDFFGQFVFQPLWDGEFKNVGGDEAIEGFMSEFPDDPIAAAYFIAAAYAVEAIKAEEAGLQSKAWDLAFDAAQWDGFLSGLLGGVDPEKAKKAIADVAHRPWKVKEPERFRDPVAHALFSTLVAAKNAKERRPTPRRVVQIWSEKRPQGIFEVLSDGVKFMDDDGEARVVELEELKKRIGRMTAWE